MVVSGEVEEEAAESVYSAYSALSSLVPPAVASSAYLWLPSASSSGWPSRFNADSVLLSPLSYAAPGSLSSVRTPHLAKDFYWNDWLKAKQGNAEFSCITTPRASFSDISIRSFVSGRSPVSPALEKSFVSRSENGDPAEVETASEVHPEDDAPEEVKSVGILELFAYADLVDKLLMLVGAIGAVVNGGALPLYSVFFGRIMNTIGANTTRTELHKKTNELCVYMTILSIIIAIGAYLEVACWMLAADRQARRIRIKYLRSVLRQNVGFFDTALTTSEVMQSISRDVSVIQEAIGDKMSSFLHYSGAFLVGYGVGFFSSWQLTLVVFAVTPLMLFVGKFQRAAFVGLASKEQESYLEAGSVARESISFVRTVKSFGAEKKLGAKYNSLLAGSVRYGVRAGFVRGAGIGSIYLVVYSTWALSLWYGSLLVARRTCSPGDVFACLFGVITGGRGIGNAIPFLANIAQGGAAAYRVFKIMDRVPPIDADDASGMVPKKIKGRIEFCSVDFAYPVQSSLVLHSFSLTVPAGRTLALVGPSGSGKSTVFSLLERFYDPQSGSILLDGLNIKKIQLKWLRQQIGLVGQEPVLYATTIAENIMYGKEGSSMEEVIAASKAANVHSFIATLPDRYNTQVGERGAQLSGGQKQRIAIARAVIRNPKILLLDEATSALDLESERLVQDALDKIMLGRTTIAIAHRLSTIENAETIAVVDNGRVVEKGNHVRLMTNESGLYCSLVRASGSPSSLENRDGVVRNGFARDGLPDESYVQSPDLNPLNLETGNEAAAKQEMKKAQVSFWKILSLNKQDSLFLLLGSINSMHAGAILPMYSWVMGQLAAEYFNPNIRELKRSSAKWALVFLGLGIGAIFVMCFQHGLFNWAGVRLTSRLRRRTFNTVLHKRLAWYDAWSENCTAGLLHCLSENCAAVRGALGDKLLVWTMALAAFGLGFAISAKIQWQMTLVGLALTPMFFAATYVQTFLQGGFLSAVTDNVYARASGIVLEAVSNIRTVAAFCSEDRIHESFRSCLQESMKTSLKRAQMIGIVLGLSQGLMFCSYTVTLWFGGVLIKRGDAKFQEVLQVFLLFVLSFYSLGQLTSMAPDSARSREAVESVIKVLDRDGDEGDRFERKKSNPKARASRSLSKRGLTGRIEFVRVHFSYLSRPDAPILSGISFKLLPLTTTAIVGPSGCGKSTILTLLQRFYVPSSGSILLDGQNLQDFELSWLRSQMAIVSQEPALFSGSIEENIAFGLKSFTAAEIEEAARAADAHNFISALPSGYKSRVGEGGIQLSGGQKQRIAIARALARNPKILLLDEATSALDTQTEAEIQSRVILKQRRSSVIIVAHRISSIRSVDRIVVLRKGVIVESGDHDKLVAAGGAYSALVNAQHRF